MKNFDDNRADAAFFTVCKSIAKIRSENKDWTDEEISYALLQTCVSIDSGDKFESFLIEALKECIAIESQKG